MLAKALILLLLAAIIYSLFSAFFFLVRDKGHGDRTVWRLTWRIVLSLVLFLGLYVAFRLGWIEPSSRGPVNYPAISEETAPEP